MRPPEGPWDPGLQNERTTLAWSRTALSVAAVGVFVARQLGRLELGAVLLVAVLGISVQMIVRADRRNARRTEQLNVAAPVRALFDIATTAAIVLALAVCGMGTVVM